MDKLPITAYCVCRNGEEYLDGALESVSFCDEIIYVDDRSTDSSEAIAKKHGAKIYSWHGSNSMSERRNYAIGFMGTEDYKPEWLSHPWMRKNPPKPKNEWILQIDHDECIMPTSLVYDGMGGTLTSAEVFRQFIELADGGRSPVWKDIPKRTRDSIGAGHLVLHNVYKGEDFKLSTLSGLETDVPAIRVMQTTVPIPRLYRRDNVYWSLSVQNMDHLIDKKSRIEIPVVIEHYGYGDAGYHFNKQFARMPQLEERVRSDPKDRHSLMYLICGLSVLMEGCPTVPDFDRLQALVQVSIWDFLGDEEAKDTKWEQITMQRVMRHFWGACHSIERYPAFMSYLNEVKQYMDYIPDVPYWEYLVGIHYQNVKVIVEKGEAFLECVKKFKRAKGQSVEVSSLSNEDGVRQTLSMIYKSMALDALKAGTDEGQAESKRCMLRCESIVAPLMPKKPKDKKMTKKQQRRARMNKWA